MRKSPHDEWGRRLEQAKEDWHWAKGDVYYVPTCYPNSVPDNIYARIYTKSAADEALRLADKVVSLVEEKLLG